MISKLELAKIITRKVNFPVEEEDIFEVIPLAKGVLAIMRGTKEKHFFAWNYLKKLKN